MSAVVYATTSAKLETSGIDYTGRAYWRDAPQLTWTAARLVLLGLVGLGIAELLHARPAPYHPGTGGSGPSATSST